MRTRLVSRTSKATFCLGRVAAYCLLAWLLSGGSPAVAQTTPAVKAYVCPAGTVQAAAEQLRNEFGMIPGVGIAADERTSQVIVVASPEIQTRISQRLAALTTPARVLPPSGPASPATAVATTGGENRFSVVSLSLRHCTAEQLEASLASILGNRLLVIPSAQLQTRRYRVASRGGENVDLTIDSATRQLTLEGPGAAVEACGRLIRAFDSLDEADGQNTRLVPLRSSKPASIQRTIAALRDTTGAPDSRLPPPAMFVHAQGQGDVQQPPGRAAAPAPAAAEKTPEGKPRVGLVNPVDIETLEGLDVLVLRGKAQDLEQVLQIINQIERISTETEPAIHVLPLRCVDCRAMERMIQKLYADVYAPRQGEVSITAVVKPNALLIVGRPENVRTAVELAGKLDQPVTPETQFQVFQLRHAAAATAQSTILDFYKDRSGTEKDRNGLAPQLHVTADVRSNALLVQACPRDIEELAALIARIDTPSGAAVNELRIIPLQHSLANKLSDILMSAIGAATAGAQAGPTTGQPSPGRGSTPPAGPTARPQDGQRSAMLRFLTIDARGRRLVESGILSDVRITPDAQANALLVSAPTSCMELIEAVIRQLDGVPATVAEVKVFTIVNSDATSLKDMLQTLFTGQASGGNRSATGSTDADGGLVGLRFAVDARTNSIIASGSAAELRVVEAILLRLDDSEVRQRENAVFRLKNSDARQVAGAIEQFLSKQRDRQREQNQSGTTAFEQIEREVVVVPEVGSNSLILSATPRFFAEVKHIVDQLDIRPPMVMIQVLIAEVATRNTDEFGIELGIQDGLLFDRSLLSGLQWKNTTYTTQTSTTQTQTLVAASNTPGYNFNSADSLGNSGAASSLANATQVAGQGLSRFSVGRASAFSDVGFGGLVLSASSESINALLRALSECRRLEILQRPQIMTLDNQTAFIQVGQKVPRIQSANFQEATQVNTTVLENVGLVLLVTPRISPDGLVVMMIDAERSEVGPEAEGTPVTVANNQVIRSPRIDITKAETTVSATSGQTVVLGGLLTKRKEEYHRKVPLLGDIPIVGRLFRADGTQTKKSELLIIMTPHIVRSEAEADAIRQTEAARMNWCLADVIELHGDAGLRGRTDNWSDAETQAVYPDMKPPVGPGGRQLGAEAIPVPPALPTEKSK
jgi:general secretion pathway protein D